MADRGKASGDGAPRVEPRTVARPPPSPPLPRPADPGDIYAAAAAPPLALAARAVRDPRPEAEALAAEIRRRIEAFAADLARAGAPPADAEAARDALLALVEARISGNPALDPAGWTRARRRLLALWPQADAARLGRGLAMAEAGGKRDLARFLRHCRDGCEAAPERGAPGPRWSVIAPLAFLAALAAWAGAAEWRHARRLLDGLPPPVAADVRSEAASAAEAARRLDAFRQAADKIARGAAASPLGLAPRLGRFGPAAAARRAYGAAAEALLPAPLGAAVDAALATEGRAVALYDTLRALAILEGSAPWEPDFVAGWLGDRAAGRPDLGALAPHVAALSAAPPGFAVAAEADLRAQARDIAREGDPLDLAFLELRRDPPLRALPGWSPEAVPDLAAVLARRSGRATSDPVAGIYTPEGWARARDGRAAAAIARMRAERVRLTGAPPAPAEAVPEAALLARLQRETLATWTAELADLRVRPFTDQPGAMFISGLLGRRGSPIEALFRAVWAQAGGTDRGRSYADQSRIAVALGPAMQFVDQGRMAEIARIFAALNVTLSNLDADSDLARRQLMDIQARAASVAALNQAPRLVTQVVEDVLAQTAASQAALFEPPAMRLWRRDLAGRCRDTLAGRYPFAAGPDADLAATAALLAPDGALAAFRAGQLAPLLDVGGSPWRWKPEARLAGFRPESAAFLERAATVGAAFFPAERPVALTLSTLAQRGAARVSLGGVGVSVATTASAAHLTWPGPDPAGGVAVAFAGAAAPRVWPGPWGLLRFLDDLPLRARDGGQRYLLDLRLPQGRTYLDLAFNHAINPASVRDLVPGLTCPAGL